MSNIIIAHIGDILKCPPALNVIRMNRRLGIETIVLTTHDHDSVEYERAVPGSRIVFVGEQYRNDCSPTAKMMRMIQIRRRITASLETYYSDKSLIWVVSDVTIKHFGPKIEKYNYVLHLMELSEELRYKNSLPYPKMDTTRIGNEAKAVVVPSSDRAHIVQAWWNLKSTPLVMHNKPVDDLNIKRRSHIADTVARNLVLACKDKKILLYQGIVHKERPLYPFYSAVKELGEDYVLMTMGSGDPLEGYNTDGQHVHVPYVQAPAHLEITSWAHIGILSYFPVRAQYSILNAVFCAPNKSFEYARFGIPMLSNDVPGMKHLIEKWSCGVTFSEGKSDEIASAVRKIEENYALMSQHSASYYYSVDLIGEYKKVLAKAGFFDDTHGCATF